MHDIYIYMAFYNHRRAAGSGGVKVIHESSTLVWNMVEQDVEERVG